MTTPKTKIEVTPEITRNIATRRAIGTSLRDLESEFGFSRPVINRVLSSDLAKSVIKGITDDAVSSAVVAVRKEFADLTGLITEAVKHHLKEKNLEAVKIGLKVLGFDSAERVDTKQAQSITVILPGSSAPKEVSNGDIEV